MLLDATGKYAVKAALSNSSITPGRSLFAHDLTQNGKVRYAREVVVSFNTIVGVSFYIVRRER